MWVYAMVRTIPMRLARTGASSCEPAPSNPAAKNTPAVTLALRSKRRCSHSTSIEVTTKPLAAESTLKSAASS